MADKVVHVGENTPEYVAYLLLGLINVAESHPKRTRQQILDLYAECLTAVQQPHLRVEEGKR